MRISAISAAALALVSLVDAGNADAAIRKTTNISAQVLVGALNELAKQRDIQVVYRTEVVGNLKTGGAAGELTAAEAFEQLLKGTGLTYRYLDENTVTIVPIATQPAKSAPDAPNPAQHDATPQNEETRKPSFWDRFRLARVDQGASVNHGTGSGSNSDNPQPVRLEEVVVTAQKREERLIDVPISIVALGTDELQKRRVSSIDDLPLSVPGLFINSNGSYGRQISLRGISNRSGSSSLVGLYLDEVPITSTPVNQPDVRTYDLERIEVLRGPQGTLYGEGSVGGTIRFITKSPALDAFAAGADVAALFTEDGEPGERVDSMVNVPLVTDKLGIRVVGSYDHEGGWIDHPTANRRDFNDQHLWNVRTKLLWQPTEELAVNALAIVYRNDAPPNRGEDANGNFDVYPGGAATDAFDTPVNAAVSDDYELYNLTVTYNLAAAQLLSSSSYVTQDKEQKNTTFAFPLTAFGFVLYGLNPLTTNDIDTFSQELRLSSTAAGPWHWTVGGFYRDQKYDTTTPASFTGLSFAPAFDMPPLPSASDPSFHSNLQSSSWAAFGDVSYRFGSRLTLATGLRYFHDDQDFLSTQNGDVPLSGSFHALSPKVSIEYALADSINAYASAAKGFRSGGFNNLNQPSYEPEKVWTYELGTKMSLLDGRFAADAALFYSDYSNYQVSGVIPGGPPTAIISNAGNARIKGLELGVTWRPVELWTLILNGSYQDAYFTEITAVSNQQYLAGDPLDFTPKYGYTASVQRDFHWGQNAFVRVDFNEQGRAHFRNRQFGASYFSESDVIQMLNLHANVQWSDTLGFGVFAQNLLDDRGYVGPDIVEGFAARSRPRNYGVEVTMRF
jgi:outer membrane receptor protein involved in Fe transport